TFRKFHETCDNITHTVTIVKVRGSNEILGGYNPIAWRPMNSYGSYIIAKNSFIFSFKDKNIEDYVLSRVANEETAIYSSNIFGPSFGGSDLILLGRDGNFCRSHSYEKPIRKVNDEFSIEEYEVFQIKGF